MVVVWSGEAPSFCLTLNKNQADTYTRKDSTNTERINTMLKTIAYSKSS